MTKKYLDLSRDLPLPMEAVTKKLAFLGISGSGKSYAAGKFTEELLGAGAQVVIVDGVGNWWGLRVAANGKYEGLPIYVFGGNHGDAPLEHTGGALMADVVVESGISAVLDVSEMTGGEQRRFVTDFATNLHRRKKRSPSPLMVIWEECQDFIPQNFRSDKAMMVGSIEKLIKQGRNYGVGATLISQRPQAVNKDVLNQVEVVLAFQTNGTQERAAIKAWMQEKSVDLSMLEELPSLQAGQCFVWSPSWLRTFAKIKIGEKWTYDASETPKFGAAASKAVKLAPVDIEAISKAMGETIERAKESDPAHLKASLTKLKTQVLRLEAELQRARDAPATKPAKRVEVSVLKEAHVARLEKVAAKAADALARVTNGPITDVQKLLSEVRGLLVKPIAADPMRNTPGSVIVFKAQPGIPQVPQVMMRRALGLSEPKSEKPNGLRKGARNMLAALGMLHPREMTRGQVAMIACLAPTSGTFSAYLSDLRAGGYIVENGDTLSLSNVGVEYLGPGWHPTPPTTNGLVALWGGKLRAGARTMLQKLVEAFPHGFSRQQLAEAAGLVATSGTFSAYLSDLRRAGLLNEEGPGNEVGASDWLFP